MIYMIWFAFNVGVLVGMATGAFAIACRKEGRNPIDVLLEIGLVAMAQARRQLSEYRNQRLT